MAQASLKRIYAEPEPIWAGVNQIARGQLDLEAISDESLSFDSVLGWSEAE